MICLSAKGCTDTFSGESAHVLGCLQISIQKNVARVQGTPEIGFLLNLIYVDIHCSS
jgi:hypothetical protein